MGRQCVNGHAECKSDGMPPLSELSIHDICKNDDLMPEEGCGKWEGKDWRSRGGGVDFVWRP